MQIEDKHVVIVNDLHVLIPGDDEKGWFAQGVEIDYSACGETLDAVKRNFSIGFEHTIKEHIKKNGNIESFLRYTPHDEIYALLGSKDYDFSNISNVSGCKRRDFMCRSVHDVGQPDSGFVPSPFAKHLPR